MSMAPFKRKQSKKDRAKKTAKNAAKGVAIVEVAKHAPMKRISLIAGGIVAALVATKIVRGRHSDPAAA